jgi:hypothetical protein
MEYLFRTCSAWAAQSPPDSYPTWCIRCCAILSCRSAPGAPRCICHHVTQLHNRRLSGHPAPGGPQRRLRLCGPLGCRPCAPPRCWHLLGRQLLLHCRKLLTYLGYCTCLEVIRVELLELGKWHLPRLRGQASQPHKCSIVAQGIDGLNAVLVDKRQGPLGWRTRKKSSAARTFLGIFTSCRVNSFFKWNTASVAADMMACIFSSTARSKSSTCQGSCEISGAGGAWKRPPLLTVPLELVD